MAGKRGKVETSSRLILDSGAVLALASGDQRTKTFLARAHELRATVIVPPAVVAETVRGDGPRDSAVNRVLKAIDSVPPTTEATARLAGSLLAAVGSRETIDALIVADAVLGGGGLVLTADAGDMRRLASAHPEVIVQPI